MQFLFNWCLLFAILLPLGIKGQDTTAHNLLLTANRNGYFEGNQQIDKMVFWEKVASVPDAEFYLARGKRRQTIAAVFGAGGLVVALVPTKRVNEDYAIAQFIGEIDRGVKQLGKGIIGGGLLIGGIVLYASADADIEKAIDVYNDRLLTDTKLKLGVTANGVGLLVEF